MTDFTISLAGIPIGISALYPSTRRFCAAYCSDEKPAFSVAVSQSHIDFEREKSEREDKAEGIPVRHFSDAYLETLAVYRLIVARLLEYDVLLFHGSVVAVDGRAYLFTAASGTGKTTHTRLWLKNIPGAFVVNGDKPLLKLTESGAVVCGTPWQGKENYGMNTSVPLQAIAVLERSKENSVSPLSLEEAFPMLLQQSYRPGQTEQMRRTLDLVERLGSGVRLYRLGCNMEDEAALVAYRALSGEGGQASWTN